MEHSLKTAACSGRSLLKSFNQPSNNLQPRECVRGGIGLKGKLGYKSFGRFREERYHSPWRSSNQEKLRGEVLLELWALMVGGISTKGEERWTLQNCAWVREHSRLNS